MKHITVYSKPHCVQCTGTKKWLDDRNVKFTPRDMSADIEALNEAKALGYQSAPVVTVTVDGEIVDHWYGFNPNKLNEHHDEGAA